MSTTTKIMRRRREVKMIVRILGKRRPWKNQNSWRWINQKMWVISIIMNKKTVKTIITIVVVVVTVKQLMELRKRSNHYLTQLHFTSSHRSSTKAWKRENSAVEMMRLYKVDYSLEWLNQVVIMRMKRKKKRRNRINITLVTLLITMITRVISYMIRQIRRI